MMFQIDLKYIYISILTLKKSKNVIYQMVMNFILNDNDFHNQLINYVVLLLYCSKDARSLLTHCSLICYAALLKASGRKYAGG